MEQRTITEVKLSREVTQLFDTIYALCGEESPILAEIENKKERAKSDKSKKENELSARESDVQQYQETLGVFNEQAKNFIEQFSKYKKEDYSILLSEAKMSNWDPQADVKKIQSESPGIVSKFEKLIEKNTNECERLSSEIDELEIKISELEQAYDKALRDQENLNTFIADVEAGSKQITKGTVESIGEAMGLSEFQINTLGSRLFFSNDWQTYIASKKNGKKKDIADAINSTPTSKVTDVSDITFAEAEPIEEIVEEPSEEVVEEQKEEVSTGNIFNDAAAIDNSFFEEVGLKVENYSSEEAKQLQDADIEVIKRNLKKAENVGVDITPNVAALVDSEFCDKVEVVESLASSTKDVQLNMDIVYNNTLDEISAMIAKLDAVGIKSDELPLAMLKGNVDNFVANIDALGAEGIKLDAKELKEFSSSLYIDKDVFRHNLSLTKLLEINIAKQSGKLALSVLAQSTNVLADKIDAVVEAGEEDILKLNPEYLAKDTFGILGRIAWLKANAMEYRNNDANKKYKKLIEDPIQFRSELNGAKVDTNLIVNAKENNEVLADVVGDDRVVSELEAFYNQENFMEEYEELLENPDMLLRYTGIAQTVEGIGQETDTTYTIDGVAFSIDKFKRNALHLLATIPDIEISTLVLAALMYNSHKTEEEINTVAKAMGFSRAMGGE